MYVHKYIGIWVLAQQHKGPGELSLAQLNLRLIYCWPKAQRLSKRQYAMPGNLAQANNSLTKISISLQLQ